MTNERKYDLKERTTIFAKRIIEFSRIIPKNQTTTSLISQLVRSGTSIGANYCEADDAESKNDFRHKIGIAKKEARETEYWLDLLIDTEPTVKQLALPLRQEAKELNLIFNAIVRSSNNTLK